MKKCRRTTRKNFNNRFVFQVGMGLISLLTLLETVIMWEIHMSFFIDWNIYGIISQEGISWKTLSGMKSYLWATHTHMHACTHTYICTDCVCNSLFRRIHCQTVLAVSPQSKKNLSNKWKQTYWKEIIR